MFTIIFAIICFMIVGLLIEFAFWMFIGWLVFCLISWLLSLVGLQDYAWLVFIIFVLWAMFR